MALKLKQTQFEAGPFLRDNTIAFPRLPQFPPKKLGNEKA